MEQGIPLEFRCAFKKDMQQTFPIELTFISR